MKTYPKAGMLFLTLTLAGCATASESPVDSDQTIPFAQIKSAPDTFKGHTVVLGGEVLAAKRLKEGTRIEVLQLPLNGSQAPVADLTQSQGRFLAIKREFLDPATIPHGTRVTVTGEVTGSQTMPLDETDYTYPVIQVRDLQVWPQMAEAPLYPVHPYPYYPYWGPWGPYWRPYPYW